MIIVTNTTEMSRRFTVEEVLEEVIADNDSNDEDFMEEVDESFADIRSDMDSNIDSEDEGNMVDSMFEDGEDSDSEFIPDSSGEASDETSEHELEAVDDMEVDIAVDQAPTLLSNNDSIPVAAPELSQSIPVAAPERSQRGRGRRGRGRGQGRGEGQGRWNGHGRGRGRGRARGRGRGRGQLGVEPEPPELVWEDDAKEVPDWLPNLVCITPGRPSIDCANYKPVDYFLATFPIEMINLIGNETNRYFDQWWQEKEADATSASADISTSNKRTKASWMPTTEAEIKAFLALMVVIGDNKRPRYKNYWSMEWLISMEGFRSVMSRDRFMSILRFLHIADNTRAISRGEPGYDRCFKIRAMLDILIPKWQSVFHIDKCTSVDECMIGFKGRIYMKQYMPKKPIKWGLKGWVLAGSNTGFVNNWQLYTGKEGDAVEVNLGQKVVSRLTQILSEGHEVYCDNYFTSYELLDALKARGIACCGTVKANRTSNPQEIKDFTAKKGKACLKELSPIFKRCGDILALGWYDKRPVTMLSSNHTSEMIVKQMRDGDSETGFRQVTKPQAVEKYNQNMGGVDLNDQLNSYSNIIRKSMKWWKKIFFHLLVTAMSNAYIMYKLTVPEKMRKEGQEFRLEVAKGLLEGWTRRTSLPGRPSLGPSPSRLVGRHFIEKMEKGRKDCVVCTKRENGKYVRRSQSRYMCKNCVPKVALCLEPPCFELYHTRNDYKAAYESYLTEQDSDDNSL